MNRIPDLSWLREGRVLTAIAVAAAVGFTAGLLIFGQPWHLPPDYGDVPTWLAALFAGVAGWVALDQLRILRGQTEREASDRRRAQASRVFAWATQAPATNLSQVQRNVLGQTVPETLVTGHIKNTSELPVYDMEVTWHEGAALRGSGELRGVLWPDSEAELELQLAENFSEASRDRFTLTLTFRDAAGVRWKIDQAGHLTEALRVLRWHPVQRQPRNFTTAQLTWY